MKKRKGTPWCLSTLLIVCWLAAVETQPVQAQTPPPEQSPSSPPLREKLPSIVNVPGDNGTTAVPWVDFPWDRVDRFLQRSKSVDKPKFIITSLTLDATASETHAVVQNQVNLQALSDGLLVVPLKMGTAMFNSAPTSNKGAVFARKSEEYGEYELILDAKKGDEFAVEFKTLVQLKRIGSKTHLRLALPSATQSSLRLTVPLAEALGQVDGENVAPEIVRDDETESTTQFELNGLPLELDFVWFPKSQSAPDERLSFEVDGTIDVDVDALGGITSDATLTAISFNKPIEALTIRLPVNTRWSDDDSDFGSYKISPLGIQDDRHEVQVVFDEPSLKPPDIRLRVKAEAELNEYELAGFEVFAANGDSDPISANNQSGVVRIFSKGSRFLKITPGDFAQRIRGDEGDRGDEQTFEYSQPNQVKLSIPRQAMELHVTPTYVIEVEETRVNLTSIFQCSTRGGSPDALNFDMGQWTFDNIYEDTDNIIRDVQEFDGKLEMPLSNAPDRFEVSFAAHMSLQEILDSESTTLEFGFPLPKGAQRLSQATVGLVSNASVAATAVGSASYAEFNPPENVRAIVAERDYANPNCFRMRTVGQPDVFTVRAWRLERKTIVDCDVEITEIELLDQQSIRLAVQQVMRWQVRDVPLTEAFLRMSRSIFEDENGNPNLRATVDGKSRLGVDFTRSPEFLDDASSAVTVVVGVEPQLASFEMVLNYDQIFTDIDARDLTQAVEFDLDLVLPKRAASTLEMETRLRFRKPRVPGFGVGLWVTKNAAIGWPWTGATDVVNPDPDVEAFVGSDVVDIPRTLPIKINRVEVDEVQTEFEELVDRAWFQTWYTNSTRTDRAVFRVKGGDAKLRIVMPSFQNLYVMVNGRPADYELDSSVLEVNLDASAASHVVELQYWLDSREPPGLLKTEVPHIDGADILGQWYWHIVMPKNECMVTWPRNLTRAHIWDWLAFVPSRRPQLSLKELEEWSGGTITGDRVLAGSTEYLFGAMGETDQLSIRTTTLPIYVLSLAGSIYIVGMLLLYYKRRDLVLLVVGLLIACLIFLHPSYASIAGQIAVFGSLLVAAAGFLKWMVRQTGRSTADIASSDSSGFGGSSLQTPSQRGSSIATVGTTTLEHGGSKARGDKP